MGFKWTSEHTKGLLVGIATIIVGIFIVIGILAYTNGISYAESYHRFTFLHQYTAKVISLAAIGNLLWFHFLALKNERWAFGQGIILATILDLIVMIVFKFIL